MQTFQIVNGGVVTNILRFDDSAVLVDGVLTVDGNVFPASGGTFMQQSGAALGWVLSGGVLVAPAPAALTKSQLLEYANWKQWSLAVGGHNVTISGTVYFFTTDVESMSLITGKAVRLQLPGAPTTVDWQFESGYATLAASDFITAAANIADWVQSTFEALKPVMVAINSGSITTMAQVDAASWPTP